MADLENRKQNEPDGPFFAFIVENVFALKDKGTVATGQVVHGAVRTGDRAFVLRDGFAKETRIAGIETFNKTLDVAKTGTSVGLQLEGVGKTDLLPNDLVQSSPTERMFNAELEQCHVLDCHCPKGATTPFCDFHHQLHLEGKELPNKSGILVSGKNASMPFAEAASPHKSTSNTPGEYDHDPPRTPGTAPSKARGGDWNNVFMSGLIAGIIFAVARARGGPGTGWIVGGAACGFCIFSTNFRFNAIQKTIALAIVLILGFYGQQMLAMFFANGGGK